MTWNKLIITACLALGILVFGSPVLADYQTNLSVTGGSNYTTTGGNTQVAQTFFPTVSNINRIGIACGQNFGVTGKTGYIAICKGTPEATQYTIQQTILPCSGTGNVLIATSTSQTLYCNFGNTNTNFDFTTKHLDQGQQYYWQFISTSTLANNDITAVTNCGGSGCTGQAYTYNSNNSPLVDLRFTTYYDSTVSGSSIITITSPINNFVQANDNNINFIGNVQNAQSLDIYYTNADGTGTTTITGLNIGVYQFNWNYNVQVPNGGFVVWYVAKQGTSTTISTTTLTISQQSVENTANISFTNSSISTTTAYQYLASTTINCASSAPAFISDPATLYTENSPIFNFASTTEQSFYMDLANNTSRQLVLATTTDDRKIEEITIVQETSPSNIVHVYCNNTEIADNRSQDFYDVTMNYHCDDAIYVDKTSSALGVAITIKYAITANGSSTVPKFYNFVTSGIYSIIKIPTDMANKLSCYLSADVAKQKGQGAGTMLGYWAQFTRGIDQIFPIPMFSIIQIWIIGLVVWFSRKLLPWFK